MEKFIPYEKLSKKEKRKIDQAKRQTWGELNPVTWKPANSKAYNRNKARNWNREISRTPIPGVSFYFFPAKNGHRLPMHWLFWLERLQIGVVFSIRTCRCSSAISTAASTAR